ncbi:MAG: ABC transporter substrate-binding protein [Oscillospiraceae bacterium]|jgi:nickel transport system substrate-binding protein|nr:ABC transporter substrate-binding protein [Oscillospiraceae bacterium]
MKSKILSLALAALMLLAIASCGAPAQNEPAGSPTPSEASESASPPGESGAPDAERVTELTFCESWDFESGFYTIASPDTQSNYGALYWSVNFYETLVNYDDGEFVPGLAESWEVSGDGAVYTFKLRQGVKFSDGSDFTSAAVKKSFEAAPVNLGPYNGSYGTLTTLFDEIVCPDDYTVELHLTQPYYGTLKDLTMLVPLAIVNPAALGDDLSPGDSFKAATHGTGPYMYAGDGDGSAYTFIRNPYYWGEQPALESFRVKVIPDNNAKLLALKSGEIDVITGTNSLSYDGYNEMSSAAGFAAAISAATDKTRYIAFNLAHAGFDDLAVRDALARAVDKDAICASLLSGLEPRADSLFPKSYPWCDVDVNVRAYDVEAAKAGLDAAGWIDSDGDGIREKDGVKLSGSMVYMTGNSVMDDLALTVSAQAREIGIELIPKGGDLMSYYADVYGDFGVALTGTYGLAHDPCTSVTNMNPELGADPVSAQATALLPDPAGLIKTLNSTADESVVRETYRAILTSINDNAIFIPISESKILAAYNADKIAEVDFDAVPQYVSAAKVTPK